ncbi:MAG: AsmA family protein [Myxococcota bacterium]
MKRLWVGLGLTIAVVAIAAQQIAANLSLERLRPVIERDLGEILGLEVQIAGVPRIELFPQLQFEIEDVRIANLPGRPSPYLLVIGRMALELRILPLFRKTLVIDALELYDAEIRIEPDEQGAWSLHPNLAELDEMPSSDEADPIALAIRELVIHDLQIYFDRSGEEDVTTLSVREFVLESEDLGSPLFIEGSGLFEGGDFEIEAEMGSLEELLNPTEPFPLELQAWLSDASFEAKGTLGNPMTLVGIELRVSAEIPNLASGAHELGLEFPPLGSVSISGVLVDRDSVLAIESLSAHSGTDGSLELDFEGTVRDLLRVEGVDLHLRVFAPDADLFKTLTSLSLPGVPLRAELEIDDEDGSLGIEGVAEVARPGSFDLTAGGVFGDLRHLKDLDVLIGFETTTLDALFTAFARDLSWELPELGPLEATGRLMLRDGNLGLEQIDVRLGDPSAMWVQLSGSVGDVLAIHDVELEVRLNAKSAREVAALGDREIPEIGPLTASLWLRDEDGSLGIENAILELGSPDTFHLRLSGSFDDLLDLEEVSFEATFEARDLGAIEALLEVELPPVGPVAFSGEVRGSAESLRSRGQLRLNRTVFEGELSAALSPEGRLAADLRVASPLVHLPDLLGAPSSQAARLEGRGPGRFDFKKWWVGDQPLPLERLRVFDAKILFEAERVTGYELLDLHDLRVAARLEDGHLIVDDIDANYERGRVSGRLEVDTRPLSPTASFELEAFNVDLTRLMSQFQKGTKYAGLLDLSVQLETAGGTAPEIRSNLQGVFGAMLRDGALVNKYSKALSFNVLRVSIPSFSTSRDSETPIHCLLAIAPIEDGVAEMETLYLEGKKVTITGEGRVDLARDRLDLMLTPRVHDPGLLSVAATVEISGSIGSPVIRPIRRSMLKSALGALYQNAVRPLGAIDRAIRADDVPHDPCGMVARRRIRQMMTEEIEPIDLQAALDLGQ